MKTPTNDMEAFSHNFVEQLAPMLVESHMSIMFRKKTHFVGTTALQYSIKFMEIGTRLQPVMNQMAPYIDNILFETAVPIIIVTNHDDYQLHEEPIEFIRRQEHY